jgi:hypothetical protein
MGLVIIKCAKLDECNDWPMLGFNQHAPWWFGIQRGILNEWDPCDLDVANSSPKCSF